MATELRDSDQARTWLMQGVWLQRLAPVNVESVGAPLACALALAATDEPIPPLGFIADVIRLVESSAAAERDRARHSSSLNLQTVRAYEDYVLGKLYADASFERASVAICGYEAADRIRAIAWLLARICERCGLDAVLISPSAARSLQSMVAEDLLEQGAASLEADGLLELLSGGYEQLISAIRSVGDVLSPEDVFELEHGTALVEFGQRLALRQTLRAAENCSAALPTKPPRPTSRQRNVPTRILEEDMYPIGGFTSISTRGSIESLLHSQLAYMEKDEARRPDLFEIKFLRSELLYYSRDENEFLRRRRVYQFVLFPDLTGCRRKDKGAPFQRMILILGMLVTLVRRLEQWLSDDALVFEFLFVDHSDDDGLQDERELLGMILKEHAENGTVVFHTMSAEEIVRHAEEHARRSVTHSLLLSTRQQSLPFEQAMPLQLQLAERQPQLLVGDERPVTFDSLNDAMARLVAEFL
ncbi:MAG: hypothetical protein NXI04_23115 [Planctomycetaceae bacterium]|nr:hypothetical protein [Planctomycetaceae bacterium]